MKKSLIYFSALMLGIVGSTALTSCDNDWEYPPMVVPEATIEANTTIADLKAEFYQSGNNYATLVGTKKDGSHYIIEGYVSTSDQAGNYFKQLVIQDETSAIQLDVDAYDLYLSYQLGQKIVLDVTGLYIGAYGSLMQIGDAPTSGYPSRIVEDTFAKHAQRDGLSNASTLVQPLQVTLETLNNIKPNTADGIDLQNRLVLIEGVTFQNAGKQTLSTSGNNVSQTFSNSQGSAILYTSGYSDFWDYYCPTGTGNIIGILSCYNGSWQIRLIDIEGLQGFDELTKAPTGGGGGTDVPGVPGEDGVYSVGAALTLINSGNIPSGSVRVRGVISAITELNTQYGNATYEIKDDLSDGQSLTVYRGKWLNGASFTSENQIEVGGIVVVEGGLELYSGKTPEVSSGNSIISYTDPQGNTFGEGSSDSDVIVTTLTENFAGGAIPSGWTQVQAAGNKSWYVTSYQGTYYASMTGYQGTAPFDQYLITPAIDMDAATTKNLSFETEVNGYGSKTSKFQVYVITDPTNPTADAKELSVKLPTAPDSGYSTWTSSDTVDLSDYKGIVYIAFRYSATTDANYATWCLTNVNINI